MRSIAVFTLCSFALSGAPPVAAAALGHDPDREIAGTARGRVADLGPAAEPTRVRLAVVLRYRNEPALRDFVAATRTGNASLARRRMLDAQTFRDLFAPSATTYAQTISALQAHGLRIEKMYANRTLVDISGSPKTIGRAFETQIDRVRDADGTIRTFNVGPAYLPPELRDSVAGVAGFDGRRAFEPAIRRAAHRMPMVPDGVTAAGVPSQGPDSGFSPVTLAKAYNFPVFHAVPQRARGATYDGTGEAAAIVIDADFLDSDLATYLKYFKIKATGPAIRRVPIQGGAPPGLSRDSVETVLDVQTIVGTSPGVALSVYELDTLSYASVLDAYNQIDTDAVVGAVNSSFGGCETQTIPTYFPQLADYLALQGAALGIVFAASTGDSGAYDVCGDGTSPDGIETPASGPTFMAVGGTTLFFNPLTGGYRFEFGWSGSGGGVSAIFPTPSYQSGVPNLVGTTRNVPDIAFDADPGSGESMYLGGQWVGPVGGTSLASPLFIGLATQLAQVHGALLGDVHAPIYATFAADGYTKPAGHALFHDSTIGQNGYYPAQAGYDLVTGIGSLNGWNYATAGQL